MAIVNPIRVFQQGVESYIPYLQPTGELHDPLFGEPTQYGTGYYALCNAILSALLPESSRQIYQERALSGLLAAIRHVAAVNQPSTAAKFWRDTGRVDRLNHRDFFWPPILKTYILLKQAGLPNIDSVARQIARIDIESAFSSRPPKNWAAVWLLGEWFRWQEGLSPYSLDQFDQWLEYFFRERILLEQGLYQEPGHPNSYDLFTRYHLAELLVHGYKGRWQANLEQLLRNGIRRSLAVQLSDGSLASAYRSSGQTWTLGAQCAYFMLASRYFANSDTNIAEQCTRAARLALHSFCRWQRQDAPYSPVENCLPPGYRVGYENYTADGHYGPLALAFLGTAILSGLDDGKGIENVEQSASIFIEHAPIYRAIVHYAPYSLHINAFPTPEYDAFGIVDLTFGQDRFFHFASSVRYMETRRLFNLGMATRNEPGRSELTFLNQQNPALIGEIKPGSEQTSVCLQAQPRGQPCTYRLEVAINSSGVLITEATPGLSCFKTLIIPYLRDPGTGSITCVSYELGHILFVHGAEKIAIEINAAIEHVLDLSHGFENRRGLCGLVRVDLTDPCEQVSYRIKVLA